jgi:hypothetical protein
MTVQGKDNGIYLNKWNGAGWAGWVAPAGGATLSGPGVIVSGDALYLMVHGTDNGIYWCSGTWGVSWSAWTKLSGATLSFPMLAWEKSLHVFFVSFCAGVGLQDCQRTATKAGSEFVAPLS